MTDLLIIGCGGMGNQWADYAAKNSDIKVVGLVDINIKNAEVYKERYHFDCPMFTDIEEAILATKPQLIFDITIPEVHHTVVMLAAKHGISVLGEKPLADTLEHAEEMVKTMEKKGLTYSIMQNRRYIHNNIAFKDLIQCGTIGKVGFINADFFLAPHFGGFREAMESPLILDMAIHTFDQARFVSGADAVSVYCVEFNTPGSWYNGDASAICIFEMSDGSVFCYRGSWSAIGAETSWEANWRVIGSKGTALWDGDNLPWCEYEENGELKKMDGRNDYTSLEEHPGCIDDMYNCYKAGKKAQTDCTDNIKSIRMVFAAIESSRTGKKVML